MLEYEKQIFLDILQEDGLVIAAKGLGLDSVVVNLLKVFCDPGNLVFVLGAEGKLQEWLVKKLKETGVNPQPKVSVEVGLAERKESYLDGGLWFVPPRILVVDLLKKRLPVDLITGFIVCKAHNILKNHLDAFVLRLFRQGNKTGFIKGFSDQAPAFTGGFNKIEKIMKALFIRNLLLWPRYHSVVKSSLNQYKPLVVELHLDMSQKMLQLQTALLDLIKYTVQEIKRLNPTLQCEELTIENAIGDTFHKILHTHLDPVWHALSDRTKSLLSDLKLLQYILITLLSQDSVSFYSLVNSQRTSDCAVKGSGWHFLPSAEILFAVARQRVFVRDNELDPEPNPKWLVLSEILNEIHEEFAKNDQTLEGKFKSIEKKLEDVFGNEIQDSDNIVSENEVNADVIILTRDERNCFQLQSYLTMGSKKLLEMQYRKMFTNKQVLINANEESPGKRETKVEDNIRECYEQEEGPNEDTYVLSLSSVGLSKLERDKKSCVAGYFEDILTLSQKNDLLDNEQFEMPSTSHADKKSPVILIKAYKKNLSDLPHLLQEKKPRWIIVFDIEMTLVRQLEVYQRSNPNIQVKVYFLVFGGTVEEQAYLTSLRKEKEAFDYLISEKARVVIPADFNDYPELKNDASSLELINKTRKGGMEFLIKKPSKIIVDMREFRSELPALIHSRGIEIEPLTITVGDYILTPDICLERKSISDLIHSLNSGRLYNQAMAMTRYYSRPMLLIEFDKDKPFDLQDRYYLSTDASSEQLVTKLQLLTLHFPQIRLIWSPNPLATAQLFEELKQGHPEPDSNTVLCTGIEQTATDEDKFNPGIQKFLLNLPGVTSKNLNLLLLKGKSLDYLQSLSKEEISDLIQNSYEAELLYNAIHNKFEPSDSSTASCSSKGKLNPSTVRGKRKRFH